jgi:hypothetical protein
MEKHTYRELERARERAKKNRKRHGKGGEEIQRQRDKRKQRSE